MEQTLESLLSTLAVDVLIFLICVIISSIIRKSRNTTKSLILPEEFNQRPYLNESESSFWDLIKRVYSFSATDLIKTLSFKSYIFMELHRDIIYGLLAMTLFGFTALIPVYSQGTAETEYELDKYSITNALESENLMIAPVCMIFIYSTIIYSVIIIYQKRCRQEEADTNDLSLYSICVYGLPKQQSAQKLQGEFSEYVSKAFGENRVSFAYIVGNYTEAYVLDRKIKKLKAKLWHAEKYFEMKGKRLIMSVWPCKKKDAIKYYEEQIHIHNVLYDKALEDYYNSNTGFGFVVLRTQSDRDYILNNFVTSDTTLNAHSWILKIAPAPREIKWQNLNLDHRYMALYRFLMFIAFLLVFLIFMTPLVFLNYMTIILQDLNLYQLLSRFLSTYLSPLLLILYQSVVLPYFVYFMVSYEKHIEKSKETVSELKRFLIYNLLYVFFFPIVGLSFMNMITSLYEEGFSQWKLDVARSISHSGYFYTTFLIHQTFLTQGFELLSPIRLLHIKIRQWRAVSDEERDLAYRASEYLWAYHYAQSLTNFVIVSSIAIVYPIILPIGLMYFVVKLIVHKYLMLCVYYIDPKSSGNRLFKSILTCLIVAILIFHLITASQLIICGFETVRVFGIVVSVLSIVMLVFSIRRIHALIKMIKKKVTDESVISVSEPLMHSDPREFIHPIEKRLRGYPAITPISSSLN